MLDPTDPSTAGLVIDDQSGLSWTRIDASSGCVEYFDPPEPGMSRSNAGGASGTVGVDGGTLEAGSGTITED